jgi:ribosomal protein L15
LTEIAETNTVDLTGLGYTKLLGTGRITKPLTVTVPTCSKSAEEKSFKQAEK